MQLENLLKLVDAGFTKEEIVKLAGVQAQTQTIDQEVQQTPKEEQKLPDQTEQLTALVAEVKTALSDFRKAAIQNDEQPAQQSVDDILSSILK